MTSRLRYLAAVAGRPHDRVPVTPIFMAWAAHFVGRTYRAFYLDGDVLVEAQLAVTRAFGVDQVSVISDPWRESSAYGMECDYPPEGVGVPRQKLFRSAGDVARLAAVDFAAAPRTAQRIDSVGKLAAAARKCIADAGGAGSRFILKPGCEVPPGTAEANVRAFCPAEGCLIRDSLAS